MAQRQRISQGSGAGLTFESQPNLVIAREHICSQRPGPLVDESDCGLGILDHQNRQNRPENLLLHYWRIWRRTVQHGRRDIPGGTIDLAAANDSTGQVEHAGHLVNLARLNSGRGSRTIISGCHIRTGRRLRRIVRAAGHLPRATAPSSHGIEAPPNHIHGRAYRRCPLHQRRARLLRRHGADRQ